MKNLNLATDKLIELIEGQYDEIVPSPWGMDEYNHYEKTYLSLLTDEQKISIFRASYEKMQENSELRNNIKQLFYLASCFNVKFSKEYISILRDEKSETKKRIFFEKVCYYIEDRWSEQAKAALSESDKYLLKTLCTQYNLPFPITNE